MIFPRKLVADKISKVMLGIETVSVCIYTYRYGSKILFEGFAFLFCCFISG